MNLKIFVFCVTGLLAFSCGEQETAAPKESEYSKLLWDAAPNFTESKAVLSSAKLREYCRACHAVGSLRFIYDDSDENLWTHILTKNVPGKSELWAAAIVRVLSWPTDVAPAPSPLMDPPSGRDWMPKGSKRLHFAADSIDGVAVRRYVLTAINDELSK